MPTSFQPYHHLATASYVLQHHCHPGVCFNHRPQWQRSGGLLRPTTINHYHTPSKDILIVQGVWNAKIGKEARKDWPDICWEHSNEGTNGRGLRFCKVQQGQIRPQKMVFLVSWIFSCTLQPTKSKRWRHIQQIIRASCPCLTSWQPCEISWSSRHHGGSGKTPRH